MKTRKQKEFTLNDLENLNPNTPVNVVLSGGGKKGVAHIAFLQKLEELGIKIHSISACSAGSLVGGMYASGMSFSEILGFFLETPLFKYSYVNTKQTGIFNTEKYRTHLVSHIKSNFESLNIPLFITTTNLEENCSCYFHSGDLILPVLASCCVPAVFNPIKINNQLHCDGGVMDNFPIFPVVDNGFPIIGSYLGNLNLKQSEELSSIMQVSRHSAELVFHAKEMDKINKTQYSAIFPLQEFSGLDMKNAFPIYQKACRFLNQKPIERKEKEISHNSISKFFQNSLPKLK